MFGNPTVGDLAEELEDSTYKESLIESKSIVLGSKTASAYAETL